MFMLVEYSNLVKYRKNVNLNAEKLFPILLHTKLCYHLGVTEQQGVYNALVVAHHLQFQEIQLFIRYYILDTYYLLSLFKLILLLPYKIPHLLELGINALEFLPVFEFDELELQRRPNPRDHMVNKKSIRLYICVKVSYWSSSLSTVYPQKIK